MAQESNPAAADATETPMRGETPDRSVGSAPSFWRWLDDTHVPMLLARLILGGMFIVMAVSKIQKPVIFLKNIREYHLLPENPPIFINLTTVGLPWIELICGVLLIVGFWLRGSALVVLSMLLVFTTAIFFRAWGVYQNGDLAFCGIAFDCGCGAGVINICKKLAENLSLIALSVITLLSASRRFALESLPAKTKPA